MQGDAPPSESTSGSSGAWKRVLDRKVLIPNPSHLSDTISDSMLAQDNRAGKAFGEQLVHTQKEMEAQSREGTLPSSH